MLKVECRLLCARIKLQHHIGEYEADVNTPGENAQTPGVDV
jgi:hypothetical protein